MYAAIFYQWKDSINININRTCTFETLEKLTFSKYFHSVLIWISSSQSFLIISSYSSHPLDCYHFLDDWSQFRNKKLVWSQFLYMGYCWTRQVIFFLFFLGFSNSQPSHFFFVFNSSHNISEKFHALNEFYCRNAHAAILVFGMTLHCEQTTYYYYYFHHHHHLSFIIHLSFWSLSSVDNNLHKNSIMTQT